MGLLGKILGNAGVVENDKLNEDYGHLLMDDEKIEIGFKLIRDVFMFTDKRLILIDVQGITGKKIEYKTLLYNSISRFSIETAGRIDLDAELKIWLSGEQLPAVSKTFNKSVNIYDVQKVLGSHILK